MKVSENNRSRQNRRRSSRPCPYPYDLRRRVLVNNFLRDSTTPPRCPSPVSSGTSGSALKRTISIVREEDEDEFNTDSDVSALDEVTDDDRTSSDSDIPSTVVNALESLKTDDVVVKEDVQESFDEGLNQFSPETAEFLYLMSRRLRISEGQKLHQPCRRSTRSQTKLRRSRSSRNKAFDCGSSSSSVESDQNSEPVASCSRSKDLFPLRSYPTFDRLNEVFECNEDTMKKTAMFLRKRMNSLSSRGLTKISFSERSSQRSGSLRQSLRNIFKPKKPNSLELAKYHPSNGLSTNSSDNQESSDPSACTNQGVGKKLKRRDSIVSRLMNSVRRGSSKVMINESELRLRTRSNHSKSFSYKSFPQLPKLRHRSASFNLKRNASTDIC